MPSSLTLLLYVLSGAVLGTLMIFTGIPAASLLGAIIGAGILSASGKLDIAVWPLGTKTALGIGIGTVIGSGLNQENLKELQKLWKPALIITITLLFVGFLIAFIICKFLGIDPVIAILGSAPGGTIGMSLVGSEYGVGPAVAALHAFRLITILSVIPFLLKLLGLKGDVNAP